MLRSLATVVCILLFFPSSFSYAIGGMGGLGELNGAHNSSTRSMRNADHQFDRGKAIVSGRNRQIGKLKFCVISGDEKVKVKRKTLKPYKGVPTDQFINSMYNCENPEELVLDRIGAMHMSDVVYYLNKRYKLKLTEHSKSVIGNQVNGKGHGRKF
jgi:hypothetical protein